MLSTPINGKFKNKSNTDVFTYLCINLQNININKKYNCRAFI